MPPAAYSMPPPPAPTEAEIKDNIRYGHESLLALGADESFCQYFTNNYFGYKKAVGDVGYRSYAGKYYYTMQGLNGRLGLMSCDPKVMGDELDALYHKAGEMEADLIPKYHAFLKELTDLKRQSEALIKEYYPDGVGAEAPAKAVGGVTASHHGHSTPEVEVANA